MWPVVQDPDSIDIMIKIIILGKRGGEGCALNDLRHYEQKFTDVLLAVLFPVILTDIRDNNIT